MIRTAGVYQSLPWWIALPYLALYASVWVIVGTFLFLGWLVLLCLGFYRRG